MFLSILHTYWAWYKVFLVCGNAFLLLWLFFGGILIFGEIKMTYEESVKQKLDSLKNKENIYVLGIESSCDETSISIVKNGREVLTNIISSQIEIHKRFGGVVPEVASRNHVEAIDNVLKEALLEAKLDLCEVDAVAVTYGAGLIGALMVGVAYAKSLAYSLGVPLVRVNHIKGHMAANYIADKTLETPFIGLIVSGGHTAIVRVDDYLNQTFIGSTLDDAIGEAYDKVARVLGLEYPGGPKIDKLSKEGKKSIEFVKIDTLKNTYNISYSGLKTAVINYVHKKTQNGEELNKADICASFQSEAVDGLVERVVRATKEYNMDKICIAGGVAANSYLRDKIMQAGEKNNIKVYAPPIRLCTDNAAMIACLGYYNLINNSGISDMSLSAEPSLKI